MTVTQTPGAQRTLYQAAAIVLGLAGIAACVSAGLVVPDAAALVRRLVCGMALVAAAVICELLHRIVGSRLVGGRRDGGVVALWIVFGWIGVCVGAVLCLG